MFEQFYNKTLQKLRGSGMSLQLETAEKPYQKNNTSALKGG